jgi:hypothetical protein
VEDPAWLESPALESVVWPQKPAAEIDRGCSFYILVLFVAVWRWDGGLSGEMAVIGDLRSIASLCVFGREVRSIGTHFEVSSLFRSFLSPASLPLMVFCLSFLPSRLSCSIPCDFPL